MRSVARFLPLGLCGAVLASGCYQKPSAPEVGTDATGSDSGTDGTVTTTETSPATDPSDSGTSSPTTASASDPTATGPVDSSEGTAADSTGPSDESTTAEPACGDGNVDAGEFCPPDAPTAFVVGNGAQDVVIADVDGGPVDLVSLNVSSSTISILSNLGDEAFAEPQSETVADNSCRIAAVDGEGDGDVDLVIAGDTIVSLVNDGASVFTRIDSPGSGFGGCEDHNDLGVLNDDGGPLDVVFSGAYNNSYAPGINQGAGWHFGASSGIGAPGEGSSGVTVTELSSDPDNLPDVVALNQYYGEGQIFRGDGDGGFVAAGSYDACSGLGQGARFAATGDLDSDGNIDIVTTCMQGNFTIALGNADGTFDAPVEFVYAGAHRPFVADLNHDDYPDVLVTSSTLDRINVYLNDGAALADEPVELDVGAPARSVDVGDLNGDGAADIVAATDTLEGGRVLVFFAQP